MLKLPIMAMIAVTLVACTKKQAPVDPSTLSRDQLKSRGKQVFMANCVSCHNSNPQLDGPLGPPVAGSSLDLLKARVIDKTYPAGYKPKRPTSVMPPFPQLSGEVDALAAYLSDFN